MLDCKIKGEFVNPYNFIPLGEMKKKSDRDSVYGKRDDKDNDKNKNEDLLSGYLDVSMYLKTPLIVPDAAHKKEVDVEDKEGKKMKHAEYDFFNVTDENGNKKYIIPGSTLRGSIRRMYEAATNSCFPFLMDDNEHKPSSYRLPLYMHLTERGLLHYEKDENNNSKGSWVLYSTEEKTQNVYFDCKSKKFREGSNYKSHELSFGSVGEYVKYDEKTEGYIQYNEPVCSGKYNIRYLKPDEEKKRWDAGDDTPYNELLSAMTRDGVSSSQGQGTKYQKRIADLLDKAKNDNTVYIPVYYLNLNKDSSNKEELVYLSNASIGRIGQHRKWKDIVGAFSPCEDTSELCPACMLFGTVNGNGMKGHVRFTDALPVEELDEERDIKSYTLDILGKPRHSAYEFYVEKTDGADYWNYDFSGNGAAGRGKDCSYKDNKPKIRGRKMYWHIYKDEDKDENKLGQAYDKTNMNSTMKAVEKDKVFKFKIYFDEITKEQLEALEWVVSLGDNSKTSPFWHKIGHGKPLGFGSVKLVIDRQVVREINNDFSVTTDKKVREELKIISKENTHDNRIIDFKSPAVCDILLMTDMNTTSGLNVSYPVCLDNKGKNTGNIYNWFSGNRQNKNAVKVLPILPEKNEDDEKAFDKKILLLGAKCDSKIGECGKCKDCTYRLFNAMNPQDGNSNTGDIDTGDIEKIINAYIKMNKYKAKKDKYYYKKILEDIFYTEGYEVNATEDKGVSNLDVLDSETNREIILKSQYIEKGNLEDICKNLRSSFKENCNENNKKMKKMYYVVAFCEDHNKVICHVESV